MDGAHLKVHYTTSSWATSSLMCSWGFINIITRKTKSLTSLGCLGCFSAYITHSPLSNKHCVVRSNLKSTFNSHGVTLTGTCKMLELQGLQGSSKQQQISTNNTEGDLWEAQMQVVKSYSQTNLAFCSSGNFNHSCSIPRLREKDLSANSEIQDTLGQFPVWTTWKRALVIPLRQHLSEMKLRRYCLRGRVRSNKQKMELSTGNWLILLYSSSTAGGESHWPMNSMHLNTHWGVH